MKQLSKFLIILLMVVMIIAVVGGIVGYYFLTVRIPDQIAQQSFPQVDGELTVAGLDGPVDIYRDEMGVPYIYANTAHDLFFAQGYVHAQERFWQMDFWRHIGSGTTAELFGKSQLETDMFLRTLGWRQTAELEYEELNEETRQILQAYADGVNAYIADREPVEISLEYLILTEVLNRGYEIEPWEPINSMTWAKAMAWDLRGNMGEEIERAVLLNTLTIDQINELFPPYPADHPIIVPEIGGLTVDSGSTQMTAFPEISAVDWGVVEDKFAIMESLLGRAGAGIGSNSWAVSGDLTATGMPILANDPHLSIQMPSIWFQNNLHCAEKTPECPFEVGGFSFAGVPGVVIGHNDSIAWGFTNVGPDVMDLYVERVNPDNPNQYEYNGSWVFFETREEVIQVAGSDPYVLKVRLTRHGPVISDTYGLLSDDVDPKDPEAQAFRDRAGIELPEDYVVSLSWTALRSSSPFEAIWGFNTAKNFEEFRQAAQHFHVPAQNLLYADVYGNIAYQMPGDIPIRAGGDGRLPVPGWTDEYDWIGYVPFEELPYVINPASGFIATANNQVPPWDYPYLIGSDWDYGYRAARIVELLQSAPAPIDIAYIQSMQADTKNLSAEFIIPILMSVDLDSDLAQIRDDFFSSWDYRNEAGSQSAALYEWFWWNLLMGTFKDDLPEEYWPKGGSRWFEVMRNLVQQPDSGWWDDKDSEDTIESMQDIFASAFKGTVSQLKDEYGEKTADWPAWGDLHTATFRNASLGESGIGPIEDLFNRGPFSTRGGDSIIDATGWEVGTSFEVDWLPSMRMIVDLGNLENSLSVHTTGESGHAFHPHYIDMAPLWTEVDYYPFHWEQDAIVAASVSHLRLVP